MPDAGSLSTGGGFGDIIGMAGKQFDGKILMATGSATSGVIVAVTPANGKTFYFAKAGIIPDINVVGQSGTCRISVRNNTTIVDIIGANNEVKAAGSGVGGAFAGQKPESTIIGDSLDGDGALTYDLNIEALSGVNTIFGTILGFIEDDVDDPRR